MSRDVASVTLVGRVGNNPQVSLGPSGDRASFRMITTERRFDKAADDWVDGDEFGVSVVCWKALANAVLATVRKGDPLVVTGRIATRRFDKDGVTQYFTEVKADVVGLDIGRAGNRFVRQSPESRPGTTRPADQDEQVHRPDGQSGGIESGGIESGGIESGGIQSGRIDAGGSSRSTAEHHQGTGVGAASGEGQLQRERGEPALSS